MARKKKSKVRSVGMPQISGYPRGATQTLKSHPLEVEVFIPEDQYIDYADAWTVLRTDEEFVLSFLQLQYPVAINQKQMDKAKTAETICVARIALTPKRMRLFVETLQSQLNPAASDLKVESEGEKIAS